MTVNYKIVKESLKPPTNLSSLSDRVWESLHERRVLRLACGETYFWIFSSRERDYLIIPKVYCGCMDFELNVIMRGSKKYCYHLITQYIAESKGMFRELKISDELLRDIITEVLYLGRSNTLRKLMM